MSVFTVVIIFWIVYQVFISLMKKGRELNKNFDPLKLPDSRALREIMQKSPAGIPQSVKSFMDGYIQTEGTQGVEGMPSEEGTQGVEGMLSEEGTQGVEGTQGPEGTHRLEGSQRLDDAQGAMEASAIEEEDSASQECKSKRRISGMTLTDDCCRFSKRELLQGVVLSEILGKPRSLHPFKGPRS